MRADLKPAEVLSHSFDPDEGTGRGASGMTECLADLLRAIRHEAVRYDDSLVVCSLIDIAVEMADAANDNFSVAILLRNCARILEIEGRNK